MGSEGRECLPVGKRTQICTLLFMTHKEKMTREQKGIDGDYFTGDRWGAQGDATSILKPLGLGPWEEEVQTSRFKTQNICLSHIVLGQWGEHFSKDVLLPHLREG